MSRKWICISAGLLLPVGVSANAQSLEEKSADEIACELAGTCADFDAADDAEAAADADADAPTRGWSLGARATTTTARPAPRARAAGYAPRATSGRVSSRSRIKAPTAPGRTTLGITFPRGSALLDGDSQGQADKLVAALKSPALAKARFAIEGHSDAVGSRNLNLDLSRRRAEAVVDLLVRNGFSRDQFEVRGVADQRPMAGVSPNAAANRRVEIVKIN